MKRTGRKEKERKTLEGSWIYIREYECPNCGAFRTYSEDGNYFKHGGMPE